MCAVTVRPGRLVSLAMLVVALGAVAGCGAVVDGGGEETTVDQTVQSTPVEDPLPRDRIERRLSQGVRLAGVTGGFERLIESGEQPANYSDVVALDGGGPGIRFLSATARDCGLAYNAVAEYPTDNGTASVTFVRSGEPSGDPIRVTETVTTVVGDGPAADTAEATVTVTAWSRRAPSVDCTREALSGQDGLREDAATALSTDGLSELVRFWNGTGDERTWAGYASPSAYSDGTTDPTIGYGPNPPPTPAGDALNETLRQYGFSYNLYAVYENESAPTGATMRPVVFRGVPVENAVVVSETVTLRDDQPLTGPAADDRPLTAYDTDPTDGDGYFPIPDAFPDERRYNEVTVYLVVW